MPHTPNLYSYLRFPQHEYPVFEAYRNLLRCVWTESLLGRDYEAAVKALELLCEVDLVSAHDLLQLLDLLARAPPSEGLCAALELLLDDAILPLPTSNRASFAATRSALLHAFAHAFMARGESAALRRVLLDKANIGVKLFKTALPKLYLLVLALEECAQLARSVAAAHQRKLPTTHELARNPLLAYYVFALFVDHHPALEEVAGADARWSQLKTYLVAARRDFGDDCADVAHIYIAYLEALSRHDEVPALCLGLRWRELRDA